MSAQTGIEWTDATWNPIGGCEIESPGCAPCYAQRLAGTRLKHHPLYAGTTKLVKGKPAFNGVLTAAPANSALWDWPVKWAGAKAPRLGPGMPSLIFVGDMSDLFHPDRPKEHIDRVFRAAGRCDDVGRTHILQLLTKRAGVMRQYVEARGYHAWNGPRLATEAWPARNIWLGFSAERQREFDARWREIKPLAVAGWTIFVSYEPAIGPLVLPDDFLALGRRAQVIAGGMSGNEATPAHPDWFRALRDQCTAADVALFFKQWGEFAPHVARGGIFPVGNLGKLVPGDDADSFYAFPAEMETAEGGLIGRFEIMRRLGKKAAGRLLDGREHSEFPQVAA